MDYSSSSHLLQIFGALVFMLLCTRWWSSKYNNGKTERRNLVPEVPGGLPIIGHLHRLAGKKNPSEYFSSMADKYGPIFSIRMGAHPTVVVSSYELLKELFTTCDRSFASRPKSSQSKYLGYNSSAFGFAPYGMFWRELRKLAVVELLSINRLKSLRHYQVSEVNYLINDMFLTSKRNEHRPVKIFLSGWLEELTFNIITLMISRQRFFKRNVDRNVSNQDNYDTHVGKTIKEFLEEVGRPVPGDFIPFLGWFDFGGAIKRMKQIAQKLDAIVEKWIEEHKSKSSDSERDIIDVMLSTIEDDTTYGRKKDTIIKATIATLIVAGSDTSSMVLIWTFSNLLNNKNVLERAQEELDQKIGRDRLVNELDTENLLYLQAIIKETLRLYPPAPVGMPHESIEDCYLGGHFIPKGTRLFPNLLKVQTDPKFWSNPKEFMPERFLTTKADVNVYGQHFEFLPFLSGRRSCPGINLALQEIPLALARLLQAFNFYKPSDEPVDMTAGLSIALFKAKPLEVLVTPRLPLELYQQ
ncbi:hypothetical protein K2173_013235 [Erythroxylum novogranatense]|uniref:Cytochrome P450 n=1 Tax=Erythroxylum novogranatense TaxID=1862640 RepID=A0AAV8SCA2_9ROSI|nr:hypothetical protein K2173_013235 [Erythroxylum novogranatense]